MNFASIFFEFQGLTSKGISECFHRSGGQITEDLLRKNDFVFDVAYRDKDEVEIEIPNGYEIESKPKDIALATQFGSFNLHSELKGNKIVYTRTFQQFEGRFPASLQKEIIQFYESVFNGDRSRIVLVKKEEKQ